VLTCGVYYYILLYIYYYTYTIIIHILYIILYSSLLLFFFLILFLSLYLLFPPFPLLSFSSSNTLLLFCLYSSLLILPFHLIPHQYSFYTCRYLHILIYILSLKNTLPRTNYRRDVSSGVVLFVWCSVLGMVIGIWFWWSVFVFESIVLDIELVLCYWCFGVIVRYSAVFLPNPSRIGVLSWWMVI
jgi:hypothetical protein